MWESIKDFSEDKFINSQQGHVGQNITGQKIVIRAIKRMINIKMKIRPSKTLSLMEENILRSPTKGQPGVV